MNISKYEKDDASSFINEQVHLIDEKSNSIDECYGSTKNQVHSKQKIHDDKNKIRYPVSTLLNYLAVIFSIVIICTSLIVQLISRYSINPDALEISNTNTEHGEAPSSFLATKRRDFSSNDVSTIVNPDLFHPSLLNSERNYSSKARGSFLNVPFPTGAFWTNLVLRHTTLDHGLSYPIMVYPYGYKWGEHPATLQLSYPPLRRMVDNLSVRDIFNPDLILGSVEDVARRYILRFDPLSVTLRFCLAYCDDDIDLDTDDSKIEAEKSRGVNRVGENNITRKKQTSKSASSYWESYLVQGSPYVTLKYVDCTPVITALSTFKDFLCPLDNNKSNKGDDSSQGDSYNMYSDQFDVCKKIKLTDTTDIELEGVRFLIQTQENVTWMLFASEPIVLHFDGLNKRTLQSTIKYSGILRFALIPPLQNDDEDMKPPYATVMKSSSTAVKRLIRHSHIFPIGGRVSWKFNHGEKKDSKRKMDVGTVNFHFETNSMNAIVKDNSSREDLLMLALPHHSQILPIQYLLEEFDLTYWSIKGIMTPIVANSWSFDENLTDISFEDADTIKQIGLMNEETKMKVIDQVSNDITVVLPSLAEDIYGFGKQVARLAQLAHIIHILQPFPLVNTANSNSNAHESSILLNSATRLLHSFLSKLLDSKNSDMLVYDIDFGGIVTKRGLTDSNEDFGNGWYNDHHFHYGYILYACAILGKLNATFITEYGSLVDTIMYDVTYDSNPDSKGFENRFFPLSRHKSWFDGHSFASGLFPFANGKSQESSSEAVNCYYGAYLWSQVRASGKERSLVNFNRLLLAMEIRGAKTYWHIKPHSISDDFVSERIIYPERFTSNNYMVGNLGMNDVTATTWFGTKSIYVHMINFMPVTAITRKLFDQSYIKEESNFIRAQYDEVEMAWKGYTTCDLAMVKPVQAWKDASQLRSNELDSALSLSQVYFWISTMKDFVPPNLTAPVDGYHSITSNVDSNSTSMCKQHLKCLELKLSGFCCPTVQGFDLGCCSKPKEYSKEPDLHFSRKCKNNEKCVILGLSGFCCPTLEDIHLGCCN